MSEVVEHTEIKANQPTKPGSPENIALLRLNALKARQALEESKSEISGQFERKKAKRLYVRILNNPKADDGDKIRAANELVKLSESSKNIETRARFINDLSDSQVQDDVLSRIALANGGTATFPLPPEVIESLKTLSNGQKVT